MKYVKQRNKTDRGVACVAMLAGLTYTQAKLALFGEKHKGRGYTQTNQMRDTLKELGVILSDRLVRCVHPESLERDALIRTNVLAKWYVALGRVGRQAVQDT